MILLQKPFHFFTSYFVTFVNICLLFTLLLLFKFFNDLNITVKESRFRVQILRNRVQVRPTLYSSQPIRLHIFSMLAICTCYRTVPSAIWEIFSQVLIFCRLHCNLFEKRGKCLPTLHEATCNNYFIVKCLLKSNVTILSISRACFNMI